MRIITTLTLICCFCFALQGQVKYSKVKINLTQTPIESVVALGLECDHGAYAPGKHLINDFSAAEIERLTENNIPFEILIDDVVAWYQERNLSGELFSAQIREGSCGEVATLPGSQYTTPVNYSNGSIGGYLLYQEVLDQLDLMATTFPNLITPRDTIGDFVTYDGNKIFWMTISDNPTLNEDEPEILYTSLHHSREMNSVTQLIFYMWYLLENYETDQHVKYLVDNTKMYFIPIVNPDGYLYNEISEPNGGGLWRKNRFPGPNNTHGVDLNRNYGYQWGINDQGSSPNPGSDVYRGSGPFSEVETQAVKFFTEDKNFEIALNAHTFSNLLIRPELTDESDLTTYNNFGEILTRENDYLFGTDLETVGYAVNGDSDAWMYHEETDKPKIFAMTPEVGPEEYGFWPPESAIIELNKANMTLNLTAANLLLDYISWVDNNPKTLTDATGMMNFDLKQYGLRPGENTVSIEAVSSNLSVDANPITINIANSETADFDVNYTITPDMGETVSNIVFTINIDNGIFTRKDTINKRYINGIPQNIVMDDASDLTNWTSTGDWGLTDQIAYSPETSITDSPNGQYENNAENELFLTPTIDLTNASSAQINFWAIWQIETDYDYVQVMAKPINQNEWTALCGDYTNTGVADQTGAEGMPVYDGTQSDWVNETMPLDDFLGEEINIKFRLISDQFVQEGGFAFDDFRVDIYDNTTPTEELFSSNTRLDIYPNPVKDLVTVELTSSEYRSSTIANLTNSLGQIIKSKSFDQLAEGRHRFEWNTEDLPSGVYFVTVEQDGQLVVTKKVVK